MDEKQKKTLNEIMKIMELQFLSLISEKRHGKVEAQVEINLCGNGNIGSVNFVFIEKKKRIF
ncbi:MAG: hypothetical protein ABFD45_06585 [Smithella sp.]|jgi:hypothetical protein